MKLPICNQYIYQNTLKIMYLVENKNDQFGMKDWLLKVTIIVFHSL